MGEVYLAQDTKLDRKVALKILPADVASNRDRMERFVREAKSAAALNHANIAHIFEIGEADGLRYISMEYVEGETLRELLSRRKIELKRAVEFAAQVASALASAHKAGVIHRDIKPENLLATASDKVKVLDFGLAKLVDKQSDPDGLSQLSTAYLPSGPGNETTPGVIMGTVSYMSPEQARGEKLDHRTDIFSLGVVLYEMVTSARPFRGKSAIDTLHAIVNVEPTPITQLNSQLPPELEDLLGKALAKDLAERYQHAGDFEIDLRRFKRALDSGSLISSRTQVVAGSSEPKLTRKSWVAAVTGILLLLGAVAAGSWYLGRSSTPAAKRLELERMTLTPLTTDRGYEGEPSFSADGQTVAYVSDRTGNFEVFLKQVSGGPDINLTNNSADDAQPAFSPDGKQIAFVSTRSGDTSLLYFGYDLPLMGGDIWVMPALGGSARRIAERGNFPSWSSDGSGVVYTSGPQRRQKIFRVAASGGEPREVPITFSAGEPPPRFLLYPSYSSDGSWIMFVVDSVASHAIYVVKAEGGEPRRIAVGRSPVWGANSRTIIYTNDELGKNHSLWQIPFDVTDGKVLGAAEPLTVGRGHDTHATVSRDGKLIVFTALQISFNVEALPFDDEQGRVLGEPKPITDGSDVIYFISPSPDNRSIAFESHRGTSSHIWRLDRGANLVQLTSDPTYDDHWPRWSPDGRTIAFIRKPAKAGQAESNVWVMAADGANPQLTIEKAAYFSLSWTPDSSGLVYFSLIDNQIHLFDLSARSSRRLTDEQNISFVPTVSPDGKWLIFQSTLAGNIDIRAVMIAGGEARDVVKTIHHDFHPFVSASGRWLYFQSDHKNISRVPGPAQDWRASEPEKVTNLPESGLFLEDPQFSRDGRELLYSRGRITGDLWLMDLGK